MESIEKLKTLKRIVNELPPDQFDMRMFIETSSCGTTCCALGALALSTEGAAMGLSIAATSGFLGLNGPTKTFDIVYTTNRGKRLTHYEAGAAALGVTLPEAARLFCPSAYGSPANNWRPDIQKHTVIKHIDQLIRKLKKEAAK